MSHGTKKPHRRSKRPLTQSELERICGAARSMPGTIDGIPAGRWWLALILVAVDTGQHPAQLLSLARDAYRPNEGRLRTKKGKHSLHAHSSNALEAIAHYDRDKLFPWPKDGGKAPFGMLNYDYRLLLHRAGLPTAETRAMNRLRVTAIETTEILDRVDPYRPFEPVPGKPHQKRNAKRRSRESKPTLKGMKWTRDDSPRTLWRYFKELYRPLRIPQAAKGTLDWYKAAINTYSKFLGRDAKLDDFSDEAMDHFKLWLLDRDIANATINGYLRHLLALWRYAWRKRKVDELPRDVDFVPTIKRIPKAWSQEEMGRLLTAAAETEGETCGIPAARFWPALFLLLYDTGLRIGAAIYLKSENLDLESGWLRVDGETQKQKADQVFKLHPDTVEALKAIHPERRERIFNYHFKSEPCKFLGRHRLNDILERAGLPTTDKDKFHRIRRTSATAICNATNAEEAMRHLGHSHISVTKAYLDTTKIQSVVMVSQVMERPQWEPGKEAS